jgi:hypothetical protein
MSRGLNEGRGSGAPRILNLGTELSTRGETSQRKTAWDSGFEAAKTPWRLTSRAVCMHTVSRQAFLLQRGLRFVFFTLRQRYVFPMFVYSLL